LTGNGRSGLSLPDFRFSPDSDSLSENKHKTGKKNDAIPEELLDVEFIGFWNIIRYIFWAFKK
jgi:hypothetical protein